MHALEILVDEHGLIRQYLDNLVLAVDRLVVEEHPPVEFFQKAVEFYNRFIKNFHHHKEEYVMFVRLAQKHSGDIDAQLDTLRFQHERGRNLMVEITGALEGYEKGDAIHSTKLLENLSAYITLLRQHIHREDHVFYPMVEETFTVDEHETLLETFEQEHEKGEGNVFEAGRILVREMGTLL